MTCPRKPPCLCCEAGKPCAYVLQLDARQQAELARIEKLLPDVVTWKPLRSAAPSRAVVGLMGKDDEPITRIECEVCERPREMFTYLYEFLKSNLVRLPPCPVCVAERYAA